MSAISSRRRLARQGGLTNNVRRGTAANLSTETVEAHLGPGLPPRLDLDGDNLLLLFARKKPAGDLELLGRAVEEVLKRDREWPVDVFRLGLGFRLARATTASTGHAAEAPTKVVHAAAHASTHTSAEGVTAAPATTALVHEHAAREQYACQSMRIKHASRPQTLDSLEDVLHSAAAHAAAAMEASAAAREPTSEAAGARRGSARLECFLSILVVNRSLILEGQQ